MKTMTCKQLGGPCDLALAGQTADEVIKQLWVLASRFRRKVVLPAPSRSKQQ